MYAYFLLRSGFFFLDFMEKIYLKCILLVNLLHMSCALKVSPLSTKTHYYLPMKKKREKRNSSFATYSSSMGHMSDMLWCRDQCNYGANVILVL
jgi:hypothetical protein